MIINNEYKVEKQYLHKFPNIDSFLQDGIKLDENIHINIPNVKYMSILFTMETIIYHRDKLRIDIIFLVDLLKIFDYFGIDLFEETEGIYFYTNHTFHNVSLNNMLTIFDILIQHHDKITFTPYDDILEQDITIVNEFANISNMDGSDILRILYEHTNMCINEDYENNFPLICNSNTNITKYNTSINLWNNFYNNNVKFKNLTSQDIKCDGPRSRTYTIRTLLIYYYHYIILKNVNPIEQEYVKYDELDFIYKHMIKTKSLRKYNPYSRNIFDESHVVNINRINTLEFIKYNLLLKITINYKSLNRIDYTIDNITYVYQSQYNILPKVHKCVVDINDRNSKDNIVVYFKINTNTHDLFMYTENVVYL